MLLRWQPGSPALSPQGLWAGGTRSATLLALGGATGRSSARGRAGVEAALAEKKIAILERALEHHPAIAQHRHI